MTGLGTKKNKTTHVVDFRRLMLVSEQANLQERDFKLKVLASRSEQGLYSVCSKITSQTSKEIYLLSSDITTTNEIKSPI